MLNQYLEFVIDDLQNWANEKQNSMIRFNVSRALITYIECVDHTSDLKNFYNRIEELKSYVDEFNEYNFIRYDIWIIGAKRKKKINDIINNDIL